MDTSKRKFLIVGALCGSAFSTVAWSQTVTPPPEGAVGAEIVVTASKRAERLIDLPVAITAVSTANLAANGQLKIEDYAAKIPGLVVQNLSIAGGDGISVTLRGIGGSYGSGPTVAVYVNDIPFNNSTRDTKGFSLPEIDPAEFERIEVLRGPQGTLYGGGSLGGVLRYVAKVPTYDSFSGRIETNVTAIDGGGVGFGARGSLNVPLGERIGVRASGYYRRDAGFIDNTQTGQKNANRVNNYGGRLALGADLSDDVKVQLEGYLQHTNARANPIIDLSATTLQPIAPDLTINRAPNTDNLARDSKLVALHVDAALGFADLVSVTSFARTTTLSHWDYSPILIPAVRAVFGLTGPLAFNVENISSSKKVSQEVRLTSPAENRLSWQLAGFYTHESSRFRQPSSVVDGLTGSAINLPNLSSTASTASYEELAVFGNATYKLTDHFDVTGGVRYSHEKIRSASVTSGLFVGGDSMTNTRASEDPVSFAVSPRYHFSKNVMAYFRVATGYRPGGGNPSAPGVPSSYGPDKTINYEVGLKAEALDRKLSLDLSAFYIDWSKIQIFAISSVNLSYISNGGSARSSGLEASFAYRPVSGFTLSGNFAYTDAKLTRDLPPPNVGFRGDGLPGVARYSGQISADYEWSIANELRPSVGISYRYVGRRADALEANRYTLPSYQTVDLRLGVRKGRYSASLFATNITDKRGYLSSFFEGSTRPVVLITPRSFGLTLGAGF